MMAIAFKSQSRNSGDNVRRSPSAAYRVASQIVYEAYDLDYFKAVERSVKKVVLPVGQVMIGGELRGESDASVADNEYSRKIIDIPMAFQAKTVNGLSVNTLQEWRGIVTECFDEYFSAEIYNLFADDAEPEVAEIPFTEVAPRDRQKVLPGAIFHLLVGFVRRPGGNQGRETMVYFRRHRPTGDNVTSRLADLLDDFA